MFSDVFTYRPSRPVDDKEQKKAKKKEKAADIQLQQQPRTHKDTSKDSKLQKHSCGEAQKAQKEAAKSKDCKQKRSAKQTVHLRSEKVSGEEPSMNTAFLPFRMFDK